MAYLSVLISRLRSATPSLRFNLPYALAVRKRVRKGTGPNDWLAPHRDSESPRYDSIGGRALDIPKAHLVRQVLFGHAKTLTPFLYVVQPIGRSIWVQPAIGRNAVDDDRGVPKALRKRLLSWVLNPLMWASIRVWIAAGGLLVTVVLPRDIGVPLYLAKRSKRRLGLW